MNLPNELLTLGTSFLQKANQFLDERITKTLTLDPDVLAYRWVGGQRGIHSLPLMFILASLWMICMALIPKRTKSSKTLASFWRICLPTMFL